MLRHADPARDGAACATIYAPFVADTSVTFEEVAPTAQEFAELIERSSRTHPWIVFEDGGRVVGYASASPHRSRAAYRWAADVSIYIDPAHRRRGAGRRLYAALFELLERQGLRTACAGITLPNDASIALHQTLGFEHVGTYRAIGWKAGGWCDVSWWQRRLGSDDGHPPAELLEPQRLPDDR